MKHTITLIPGDGIGPEVSAAVVRILRASGADIDWATEFTDAICRDIERGEQTQA